MTSVPQVQITARDYYVLTKDLHLDAAIALVSVFYYESKLNPGSQGYQTTETPGVLNTHGAYAIMSLNGKRQKDLLDFATGHGLPVDNLETQLAFALTDMANGYPNCWAAIRSAASYQAIIPVLVDEYENPKNKTAEIAGALAIAEKLAALPAPQPHQAPPAAVPQVPAPQAPVPRPSQSAAPAGLPQISATSAGRRAGQQAYIASMLDQLTLERTAIDEEILTWQQMAAEFGKLNPAPTTQLSLSPVLPAPAAESATTITQGSKNMLGTSWITSLFGTGSIASVVVTLGIDIYNRQIPDAATIATLGGLLSAGSGLLKAKDNNVTGGTVSAITGTVGKPVSLIDKQ